MYDLKAVSRAVEKLVKETTYSRDTIIQMVSEETGVPEHVIEWAVV